MPFLWGGQLAGVFQTPLSVPLLRAAWWISADGQVGLKALTAIKTYGDSAQAIGCALAWMEKIPRAELAAFGGLLAANAGLEDVSRNMLVLCQQLPRDKLGLTELLEFTIAQRFEPFGAASQCARRLEDRRDLSPTVSGMVHMDLLWNAMLCGRLDEAERRAKFVLSVGQAPPASIAMSAIARLRGDETAARRHMNDAVALPPAEMHYYRFLAASGIEAEDEANEQLTRLGEFNVSLAEYATRQVSVVRGSR